MHFRATKRSRLGSAQKYKIVPLTIQVQFSNMIKYEIIHPSGPMICQHHHLFVFGVVFRSPRHLPDVRTRDLPVDAFIIHPRFVYFWSPFIY